MNLRPRARKCMRSSEDDVGRDWLSEMPDEVIVHILSFMPIVDAVRTVLLRRFGNLWTLLPNLNFDARKFLRNPYDDVQWDDRHFCHFVRNVLMLYKRLSIEKFHLCVELNWYDESIQGADDIKTWLRFALDIVQAKEVKFCVFSQFEDSYFSSQFWDLSRDTVVSVLPNFVSQYLVTLELGHCELVPLLEVSLGSLRKLSLDHVCMCDEAFQHFLCGCPSLHELAIVNPVGMGKLGFTAPNIDKLSIALTLKYCFKDPILLRFPNIRSLELTLDVRFPDFIDISSVRDINIKHLSYNLYKHLKLSRLISIMRHFEGTEVCRLSRDASEQFLCSLPNLPHIQNRWKCVVLELRDFHRSCLLGIYQLMRNSGHLEELIVYNTLQNSRLSYEAKLLPELSCPCVMPLLKTITFYDYGYGESWDHQLQLVEFLLKSSPVLDKLIISPSKCPLKGAEELEFVKRVSNFRRASATARVVFA